MGAVETCCTFTCRVNRSVAGVTFGNADRLDHNGHRRKTSLAEAKAHLSELVDAAEHRGKRILILRHGKPAAAIVPVDVATPRAPRVAPKDEEDVRRSVLAFVDEFSACEPDVSAVDDLLQARR